MKTRGPGSAGLIYDAGMNNGDDTAYYLAKGYNVIAIDANPVLCAAASQRFAGEIAAGRLKILNVGLSDEAGVATFFVNEGDSAISSFVPERFKEQQWVDQRWSPITVEVQSLAEIIRTHGLPDFVKIDIEFYDARVLIDLLRNEIIPPMISVEVQEVDAICALICMGYGSFRLSPGAEVPVRYATATVTTLDGENIPYSFAPYSSGPFDDDLKAPWMRKLEAFDALRKLGFGWVDVHAIL